MGKVTWSDNVAHVFPPGTTVEAHPRVGDSPPEGGTHTKPDGSAKVDVDGTVTFSGLSNPHGPYWAVGQVNITYGDGKTNRVPRFLAFTANDEDEIAPPSERNSTREARIQTQREAEARDRFAQKFPETASNAPGVDIVTGARSTVSTHNEKSDVAFEPKVEEPQPHPKQESISSQTPQRSSTPAGQATPKELGELQPKPSQSDVKPGTPQRSDTPFGEATPKPPDEQQPQARQEDSGSKKQRSDTPHGAQAPKPATKSPKAQEQARESSESKAVGSGSTAVAGTAKRKRASAKGKAVKATDSVKPASKRAAKKQDS